MNTSNSRPLRNIVRLSLPLIGAFVVLAATLLFMSEQQFLNVRAAPIPPPEGYPKLSLSTKVVSPIVTGTGGAELVYQIEIINTGAYTAEGVELVDAIPNFTTFTGKMGSSLQPSPVLTDSTVTWVGTVGFDTSEVITFSVEVYTDYVGIISNTAILDHFLIPEPITLTVETIITDYPIFEIVKTSSPEKPGANKPLIYEIAVINKGSQTLNLPITVVDVVPLDTTLLNVGPDGTPSPVGDVITWTRSVNLPFKASTVFTFSVTVGDVTSGSLISNLDYSVTSPQTTVTYGDPYTVTIIDPILFIAKDTVPHPPGSNREMMYILTVLNKGSLATDLIISDIVPDGVTYVSGGSYVDGIVYWDYPSLDIGESAQFSYTVYIPDVADLGVVNETYEVCSAEGVCQAGPVLTSVVEGPTFAVMVELDPIAKKPGGGGGPVTPTITVENLGPGNALDAFMTFYFERISVQSSDFFAIPAVGLFSDGPECGEKCVSYNWVGDIAYGDKITFTTDVGQSTIGGEEGTHYTATVVIFDSLGDFNTNPITTTAIGNVTHHANLIPEKSAPEVIGAGQMMTYTIQVFNSGLSTDVPPYPILTETLPTNVTLVSVSDGGVGTTISDTTTVSWTLPAMSPGDILYRSFVVQVNDDLISGTEIVNADYRTLWYEISLTETLVLSNTGIPITTVVKEIGLIDSFKTVTPTLAKPGPENLLTYVVNVVNPTPIYLEGIWVHDILPWENSTYQRDAIASSGVVISDIVSVDWYGNVSAYSTESITFTVLVDPYFKGTITNTAVITHSSLRSDVIIEAVAYITDDPVLQISKSASPNPVMLNGELLYTIRVTNLGQQATNLLVGDLIPINTIYVLDSASSGGQLVDGEVQWQFPVLLPGESKTLTFRVQVLGGNQVINSDYWVNCAEGVSAIGKPVITVITRKTSIIYLPIIYR